eukprot:512902_1
MSNTKAWHSKNEYLEFLISECLFISFIGIILCSKGLEKYSCYPNIATKKRVLFIILFCSIIFDTSSGCKSFSSSGTLSEQYVQSLDSYAKIEIRSATYSRSYDIFYYLTFNVNRICVDPKITVYFRDTAFYHSDNFLEVYIGQQCIATCPGVNRYGVCDEYKYCLTDYAIPGTIPLGGQIDIHLRGSWIVRPLCAYEQLYADVSVKCTSTPEPTPEPTPAPTPAPTPGPPTTSPSIAPTSSPTISPTSPTMVPIAPTAAPTISPTTAPLPLVPTTSPTLTSKFLYVRQNGCDFGYCSSNQMDYNYACNYQLDYIGVAKEFCCANVTEYPTSLPTNLPSDTTIHPTTIPSDSPTYSPTLNPTFDPTFQPTNDPTEWCGKNSIKYVTFNGLESSCQINGNECNIYQKHDVIKVVRISTGIYQVFWKSPFTFNTYGLFINSNINSG